MGRILALGRNRALSRVLSLGRDRALDKVLKFIDERMTNSNSGQL